MIDVEATMAAFHHGPDVGRSQSVIAICPICGISRATKKRNADGLCIHCARTHRPGTPVHSRITIKSFEQRASQVMI